MTIERGQPWGSHASLPADGVVVASDAEARALVERARRAGTPPPVLGLVGGDLCRTLGGTGDRRRLRSEAAMTFPVDVGAALLDGRLHWFVAHLVAHDRWWRRTIVVMNAQWLGRWNLGPRAHPDDGLLDSYDAHLGLKDLARVRRRLPYGSHLPHPGIKEWRAAAVQLELERPLPVWLDGTALGPIQTLTIHVEPDALTVVV